MFFKWCYVSKIINPINTKMIDYTIDTINKFDSQINIELRHAKGNYKKCPSYWGKMIYLKSIDLDLNDWNTIRAGDYFEIRDSLKGIEQKEFIYHKIIEYLGEQPAY